MPAHVVFSVLWKHCYFVVHRHATCYVLHISPRGAALLGHVMLCSASDACDTNHVIFEITVTTATAAEI